MSTLLLSLLLIVLVVMGLQMGARVVERFENAAAAVEPVKLSPALANLLAAGSVGSGAKPTAVDTLAREQEIRQAVEEAMKRCPVCERCPDMSNYIRMDEVPCWNCTLP
jgi:hypothetical protein